MAAGHLFLKRYRAESGRNQSKQRCAHGMGVPMSMFPSIDRQLTTIQQSLDTANRRLMLLEQQMRIIMSKMDDFTAAFAAYCAKVDAYVAATQANQANSDAAVAAAVAAEKAGEDVNAQALSDALAAEAAKVPDAPAAPPAPPAT